MKKNAGLSLIELIVGISLFSIAILIIGSFFVMSQKVYTKTESSGELVQNARSLVDRLNVELRQAKMIITELPAASENGVNEIFFQDGNSLTEIRYIKYYQDLSVVKRAVSGFYFSDNPGYYVSYYAQDEFGNPPEELILEDHELAEFVDQMSLYKPDEAIAIFVAFKKGREDFQVNTKIYPRNSL